MLELQSVLGNVLELMARFFDNMDDIFSIIFVLMVIFTFVDGSSKKKKRSTGMPPPTPDLDIPTLENDPNIKVQQEITVEPTDKIIPRGVTNNITENYRQKYAQQRQAEERSIKVKNPSREQTKEAALNADDALNAMILSEIFDKPKALRRR